MTVSRFMLLSVLPALAFFVAPTGGAVPVSEEEAPLKRFCALADSLHEACRFSEAVSAWDSALACGPDSLTALSVRSRRIQSLNGANMVRYASTPVVVARERFSLSDFFLFYPLPDRSWRKLPNSLDTLDRSTPVTATYAPEGAREIYFSALDASGVRDLFRTEAGDSLWTAPRLAGEALLSPEHDIFPMLSPDGKTLYFSSRGFYGMGGYDLFRSEWDADRKAWGEPVNLGFPYSSPADDFLFLNSPDGKYTLFASNRDCARDSVYIYVLEYDPTPIRKDLGSAEEALRVLKLQPVEDPSRLDNGSAAGSALPENVDTRKYRDQMEVVRRLRDSVTVINRHLDDLRSALAAADSSRKGQYADWIVEVERAEAELETALTKESRELSRIEMEFLVNGVVIDPAALTASADKEIVGASASYTFSKNLWGAPLQLPMEAPVRDSLGFCVAPEGTFAEEAAPTEGVVYQIRILGGRERPSVSALRGLRPVYERPVHGDADSLEYFVGVFHHFDAALEQLNVVRRLGFPDAALSAWYQGAPVDLVTARRMEKR